MVNSYLKKFLFLAVILITTPSYAAIQLKDEGTAQGYVNILDCTGGGVSCTASGITGTVQVAGGGAATAAGVDTQVQFNDGGTDLGADIGFVYNKTTNTLGMLGDIVISGDNITATTNTDRFVFMANGTTYAPEAINLGTDTTGNYAAGDGEAGAALTGDSATSFFSSGTIEDARLPSTLDSKAVTNSTATTPSADDNDTSIATTAYVQTEIGAMGGRSLTFNSGTLDADAELYTDVKTIWFEDPTADDDFKTIWTNETGGAITITEIACESDQTVNFDLQVDDGSATGVNGSDIACTTYAVDTSLAGDTSMADGDRLDLAIASVSGTPTWVSISWKYTKDD